VTDAGLKELAGLQELLTLDLGGTKVTDAGLKVLAGLKQLQELYLYTTPVTDAGLKELAGLHQLQNLSLNNTNTPVTDAGLKELAALKQLQLLALNGAQVTDAGLKELAGLKQLQGLSLENTKVTDAGLKELAGLKQLQWLDLTYTQVTDAGLKELARLKQLQTLNLNGAQVTDAGLKELAGLQQLQTLYLNNAKVTDAGLKALTELKQLKTLSLEGTNTTADGIAALQNALPQCQIAWTDRDRKAAEWVLRQRGGWVEVKVGDKRSDANAVTKLPVEPFTLTVVGFAGPNDVTEETLLDQLRGLNNVERLQVPDIQVSDSFLDRLAQLPVAKTRLWKILISGAKLTDAGMAHLKRFPKLTWFGIQLHGDVRLITDAGLNSLQEVPTLQFAILGGRFTDAGLKHLEKLRELQELRIKSDGVTGAGVAALQKELPKCKIVWDGNDSPDRKAAEWVLSIGGSVTINDGQDREIKAAKDLPAGPWTLRVVDLHDNPKVTDAGLKELARLKQLQWLHLYQTKVTDAGLKELAALKNLHTLDLRDTKVTDAGLKELRKALPGCRIVP
jgi:Leucine-rich repeat (LRR) protein